jgi:hypothetical protein
MTYMALLEVTDEEGRKWLTLRASTMEEAHAEVTVELIKEYDYSLYDLVEVTIVEVARSDMFDLSHHKRVRQLVRDEEYKVRREATERAQYERLQAKYGGK